jgi:hypothetical protein
MIAHLTISATSGEQTHVKLCAPHLTAFHGFVSNIAPQINDRAYPSGSVVARVFLTANPPVYTPVHESIAHRWREKEMVQPHPFV